MTYNHIDGVKCQMCGDNPNRTCTCTSTKSEYSTMTTATLKSTSGKTRKKARSRIDKLKQYGAGV